MENVLLRVGDIVWAYDLGAEFSHRVLGSILEINASKNGGGTIQVRAYDGHTYKCSLADASIASADDSALPCFL